MARKMNNSEDGTDTLPDPAGSALTGGRRLPLVEALELRAGANKAVRAFFEERDFLEVDTPHWVAAPGTDVHLDPVRAVYEDFAEQPSEDITGYLHTSPEFAMKRLLVEGLERIWQMCKVWRNGEIGPQHNPEFTLLEWYRAREPVDAIIEDVEALVGELLGERVQPPFERMTMRQLVERACGFDLLEALDFDGLFDAAKTHSLLPERSLDRAKINRRWDELFFELQVTHLDPYLTERGAVFVTDWPSNLAVLARKKPDEPRLAERFELYVDGVELANGFGELTDPVEQRERFAADNITRRARGLPELPMPERFLAALERGMPPSSGVAVGLDRILMLAADVDDIREVAPFAMRRDADSGDVRWG